MSILVIKEVIFIKDEAKAKTKNSIIFIGIISAFLVIATIFDMYLCRIVKYNYDFIL
jgi:hypothetical protein